mgnify:CR=1 FL=1
MSNKLKSIFLSLVCLALFVLPLFASAQEKFFGEATTAPGMIRNIYWVGVGIVGFAALVVIVIAGIMYMQSYGDPQKITLAKQLISSALIGVVLLLFSYTILRTINPALVRLREPVLEVKLQVPCDVTNKTCQITSSTILDEGDPLKVHGIIQYANASCAKKGIQMSVCPRCKECFEGINKVKCFSPGCKPYGGVIDSEGRSIVYDIKRDSKEILKTALREEPTSSHKCEFDIKANIGGTGYINCGSVQINGKD